MTNNDDNSISVEDGLRMAAEQFAVMDTPIMMAKSRNTVLPLAKLMRDAADKMDELKIERDRWQKQCITAQNTARINLTVIHQHRKEIEQLRAMYNNAKGMEKHYNICYRALKDILKVRYPISNEPLVDVWTIAARALNSNLDDMVEQITPNNVHPES